jgi:deoxyribonuclease-1-like protein
MEMKSGLVVALAVAVAFPALAVPPTTTVAEPDAGNLIVASFNVKFFSENRQDVGRVAQVVRHFDLCGIIEPRSDKVMFELESALETLTGANWMFVASHPTGLSTSTYQERFAYIWRTDRVQLNSGQVGNVRDRNDIHRHEPYTAFFKSGDFDFACMLIHTRWTPEDKREQEARRLREDFRALHRLTDERDIILMGDFNYDDDDAEMECITSLIGVRNLEPHDVATTIGSDGSYIDSHYDHIYVFGETTEWTGQSGAFYFVPVVYPNPADRDKALGEISDHLPVWAEFATDTGDDD